MNLIVDKIFVEHLDIKTEKEVLKWRGGNTAHE